MRPLRELALRRAWRRLAAQPARVPDGPLQWGAEMRALVLFDRDDAAQVREATALKLVDFGVDPSLPGSERVPERLAWTAVPPPKSTADAGAAEPAATAGVQPPAPQAVPAEALDVWTPKHLAFSGVAKDEAAAAVLAKAYDLILNLQPTAFTPFDYLCAGANAHLRIARHDESTNPADGADVYDVMLRAQPERFLSELRAYLRALNPTL